MSLDVCAALVERGDPDRFLAAMAAPPDARARLWPLYAFNLEIARVPWATQEPMIAEMRLQWWLDALADIAAGRGVSGHEVLAPLAAVMAEADLPVAVLEAMAEARRWDIWSEPFADRPAFDAYIDATAGNLMWLAARALAAPARAEPVVRDFAFGAGVAAWLRAVPELEARGRWPLVDGRPEAVAGLAREAQARLARARAARHAVPPGAAPALLAGWRADATLARAIHAPGRVGAGALAESEFARRGRLLWRSFTGRW